MKVPRSYLLMVFAIEMFCKIICRVFLARMPLHIKRTVFYLVRDPKEMHFHWSWSLFFDAIVGDACCCDIVAVDWWLGLFVTKFFKDHSATNFSIPQKTQMAPFNTMGWPLTGDDPRKNCPATLLRARVSDRYYASEWMFKTMLDAWYQITAFGCVTR